MTEKLIRGYLNFFSARQVDSTLIISDGRTPTTTATFAELQSLCQSFQPDLVILDSLINFFSANENSNADAAFFYRSLLSLGSTILILHHQNKNGINGDLSTAARGAVAFREQARTRLVLRDSKLYIEKMNFSEYQGHYIPLKFEGGVFYATAQEPVNANNENEATARKLIRYIQPKPKGERRKRQ